MPSFNPNPGVLDLAGYAKISLSVSGTAAQTSALGPGVYAVWSPDVTVHLKVAATADDVTTSTGFTVFAGNMVALGVGLNDNKIGAITDGASGTLYVFRIG